MATNHSIPVGHIGVGDAFEKKVQLIAGVEMLKREADDFAAVQGGGAYSEEIMAHSVDVQGVRLHVEREMRQAFSDGTLVPLFWQDGALVKFANSTEWLSDAPMFGKLENVPHRWRSYAPTCLFVGGSDRASSAVFLEDRAFKAWLQQPVRRKTGTKPKWDWDGDIKDFVFRELDQRGDISEEGQVSEWSCAADVFRAVRDYLGKRGELDPSESIMKARIPPIVNQWRERNGGRRTIINS